MAQSVDAIFFHGPQWQIDHTPEAAVAGGDLLSFGEGTSRLVACASVPIPAGTLGAVSIAGGYKLKKKAGVEFTLGQSVEWDEANREAVDADDGSGDFVAGTAIADAAAGDDFVLVAINFSLAAPADVGSE